MNETRTIEQIKDNLFTHGVEDEEYNIREMENIEGDTVFRIRVDMDNGDTAYTDIVPGITGPTEIYVATREMASRLSP